MLICQNTQLFVDEWTSLPFVVVVYHAHGHLWTIHHPDSEEAEQRCRHLRSSMGLKITLKCGERLPFVDSSDRDELMIRTFDNAL